ncbi:NAD(P)H-dependent oxidoreductase subunit E [bacterium]|nr:NAD(P)H-dependent oxidoreductase subunit E [bacterium]
MIDKTMVVCDIKQCLNCGNCITACERRHKDVSRHVRAGSALIGISLIPNLCKICKEPKCIEACNRNGVERDEDGHIVITDRCVGCGLCARACPYNSILLFSGQEQGFSIIEKMLSFLKKPEDTRSLESKDKRKEGVIDLKEVDLIIKNHMGGPGSLMHTLQAIQDEYNYLPKEALFRVSEMMETPISRIYNVVTFYKAFSLVPRGRHIISVCLGTACHVRGAAKVVGELERCLKVKSGETTSDNKFTLNTVNCLGACALGPVVVIDGEYFGKVTPDKIDSIIEKFD